jgi:hypothetical protein
MKLLEKSELIAIHPRLTLRGLGKQIFEAAYNGLLNFGAIIKRGRTVLINLDRYNQWLESQRLQG